MLTNSGVCIQISRFCGLDCRLLLFKLHLLDSELCTHLQEKKATTTKSLSSDLKSVCWMILLQNFAITLFWPSWIVLLKSSFFFLIFIFFSPSFPPLLINMLSNVSLALYGLCFLGLELLFRMWFAIHNVEAMQMCPVLEIYGKIEHQLPIIEQYCYLSSNIQESLSY